MADHDGTLIAKGNHVVPKGVFVEELDGGKKKLSKECPEALRTFLQRKTLTETYDKLVQAIVDESATRSVFGKWKDQEFVAILDLFRDEFAEQSVKVVLCKRSSSSGTFRWLEFFDVNEVQEYVSQFDVSNLSGQVIHTCYTKLEFPHGVVVEELKRYGKARKLLLEKTPVFVEKMMQEKDLTNEYRALVLECSEAGVGKRFKTWDIEKLKAISKTHAPRFEAKGVSIFVSHKQEYISHGSSGGHYEYFRWLEFVDRKVQPTYYPQRDAESKDEKCTVS